MTVNGYYRTVDPYIATESPLVLIWALMNLAFDLLTSKSYGCYVT